jgi:hypothetical protein
MLFISEQSDQAVSEELFPIYCILLSFPQDIIMARTEDQSVKMVIMTNSRRLPVEEYDWFNACTARIIEFEKVDSFVVVAI